MRAISVQIHQLSIAKISMKITKRQTSNVNHTLVDSKTVDHSDVVGAAATGDTPTITSFSIEHLASMDWAKTIAR